MTKSRPGIEKTLTGIQGFDEISNGGLPRNRTTLVIGGPGSGKTIFGLQMLVNGARLYGEPGIFVAFEENAAQVKANAASFGWDLDQLEHKSLFFLDGRMSSTSISAGNFDITGFLASLSAKAREMKATRIVFDSIGVLLSMLDNEQAERVELYRLHDWMSSSGMTGIITARMEKQDPITLTHYSFLQFMADCTVLLQHEVDLRVSTRSVRIVKYRGSSFAENEVPFVFGPHGINMASLPINPSDDSPVSATRISTGVQRLNDMLEGGYFQGSSVLVTGAPGTAKSTLCAAFVNAACLAGKKALYYSFDEVPGEILRNMRSINLDLQPHIGSGLLQIHSGRSNKQSADAHLLAIRDLIENYQPDCLVIDPISAMLNAGSLTSAQFVAQSLIYFAKQRGITQVYSSLLDSADQEMESSPLSVSTVADTWIHLSYVASGGERNRALTIIKARGTAHSNQVRELKLSRDGLTLVDVYSSGGEVLMGTLRWELENTQALERARAQRAARRLEVDLQLAESEVNAQIEKLRRELKQRQMELNDLLEEEAERERNFGEARSSITGRRGGNNPPGAAGRPADAAQTESHHD